MSGKLKLRVALATCALSCALAGCGTLSTFPVDTTETPAQVLYESGDLRAQVDALAQPLIDNHVTPGLVVGVLLPSGERRVYGYGRRQQPDGEAPDGDTLFAVGSLSKGFLGEIVASLVRDGTLHWSDTLDTLLPPGTPLSDDARRITLLQLATHTSGLPRQPFTHETFEAFVGYLFTGRSFYGHFDEPFIFHYLSDWSAPDEHEPIYSNTGYALLSYIVERFSHQSVDALLNERIVKPLHLDHTGYAPEQLPGYANRAYGYAGDQPKFIRRGAPTPDWRFTNMMRGAAALHSTVNDLLTYADAHLNGSTDTALDAVLTDALTVYVDRPKEAAAIAWVVDTVGQHKITYQVGMVAGYTSYIGLDQDNKTAVVVLQNSFNWTNQIGHRLLLRLASAGHMARVDALNSQHPALN